MHLTELTEGMKKLEEELEIKAASKLQYYSKNSGMKYENLKSSFAKKANESLKDLTVQGVTLQELDNILIPDILSRIMNKKNSKSGSYTACSQHLNEVIPLIRMVAEYHVVLNKVETGECLTAQLEKAVITHQTLKAMASAYFAAFSTIKIPQQLREEKFEWLIQQITECIGNMLNASAGNSQYGQNQDFEYTTVTGGKYNGYW